jgi:hypothetical protein
MPQADRIGQVIAGKYRLAEVLGRGGMGLVWRAEQIDSRGQVLRQVALKTILPNASEQFGDVMLRRFHREVRAAMQLSSPHVVTVHDFGEEPNGEVYFVMELVKGPTLREAAPQGLSPQQAVTIVAQVCDALAEAHGLADPIVHRDLKPANLFLKNWPQSVWVKVGDFGIAKMVSEETSGLTSTGSSLGTPIYMSPEQWRGEGIDGRADLYSLGVMLYQMLAGHAPFQGDMHSLMYKHLQENPAPLPSSVPEQLRSLVHELLAKDPRERPASAQELKRRLESIQTTKVPSPQHEAASAAVPTSRPLLGKVQHSAPLAKRDADLPQRTRIQRAVVTICVLAGVALGAFAGLRHIDSQAEERARAEAVAKAETVAKAEAERLAAEAKIIAEQAAQTERSAQAQAAAKAKSEKEAAEAKAEATAAAARAAAAARVEAEKKARLAAAKARDDAEVEGCLKQCYATYDACDLENVEPKRKIRDSATKDSDAEKKATNDVYAARDICDGRYETCKRGCRVGR